MKYAILLGYGDKGSKVDVLGIDENPSELVKMMEEITIANGVVGKGKDKKQYANLDLIHSTKGPMKRRRALIS